MLAIDFRGFGESPVDVAGDRAHHFDVLAAVHYYLRKEGATTAAVIGASFGGVAAATAAVEEPGAIDRLVLLGATPDPPDEKLITRKLYLVTRDDANAAGLRLPGLQAHFAKAPEPKELLVLPGSAHAQFMFDRDLAPRVMREILVKSCGSSPPPEVRQIPPLTPSQLIRRTDPSPIGRRFAANPYNTCETRSSLR